MDILASALLVQAVGRGMIDRKKSGTRRFHQWRQATRHDRLCRDPYSQRLLGVLQAIGRGLITRKWLRREKTTRLDMIRGASLATSCRRRRRLVPIGYKPPRTEEERQARMQTLAHRMFVWRVCQIQSWWRGVLLRRQLARHKLVVTRLGVFNARAVLIQRWLRSQHAQMRFIPPSALELRQASNAIVTVEDLHQQRLGNREKLLQRWNAIISRERRGGPSHAVTKARPQKHCQSRSVLNPIPVSGRYASNLGAAHAASRSEWNDSGAVGHKSWYSEPRM